MALLACVDGTTPPKPVQTAPLAYFSSHCSRCHGYYGANYGDDFAKSLSDAELHETVRRMAAGPGGAPLTGADLEAEVAFHRSLSVKEPFLAWTAIKGSTMKGEASPESSVTATVAGKPVDVKRDDTTWELNLPKGAKTQEVVVKASSGDKSSTMDLSKAAYSHDKPTSR